jgi:hypothetical protein
MDASSARGIAEQVHAGARESDGTLRIWHVRRVARDSAGSTRVVAWLHETLATGAISEEALLMEGLTAEELRALRLLALPDIASSDAAYLAHLELIVHAAGWAGELARTVQAVDLRDRISHPCVGPTGWSPPWRHALVRLLGATEARLPRSDVTVSHEVPGTPLQDLPWAASSSPASAGRRR